MKTIVTISLITLCLAVLFACQVPKKEVTRIVVLSDVTEDHLSRPDALKIIQLFDLNKEWNGAEFRFVDLTEVSYNLAEEVKLQARSEWWSNELDRDTERQEFTDKVSEIIDSRSRDSIGRKNSSIYMPLARELDDLGQSRAQRKVIVIYSDLMENTHLISMYQSSIVKELKDKSLDLQLRLERLIPVNSLQGIEIYMIYQPPTIQSDEMYRLVSEFYRQWFESLGAKVKIAANLNT